MKIKQIKNSDNQDKNLHDVFNKILKPYKGKMMKCITNQNYIDTLAPEILKHFTITKLDKSNE